MSFTGNDRIAESTNDTQDQIDTKDHILRLDSLQRTGEKDLEDEIYRLRNKMEQAVWQEHSMTSEVVVQISSKLDRKINEYMKILKLKKEMK